MKGRGCSVSRDMLLVAEKHCWYEPLTVDKNLQALWRNQRLHSFVCLELDCMSERVERLEKLIRIHDAG